MSESVKTPVRTVPAKPKPAPNVRLIELRMNKGLSQRDLSYWTGISVPTINRAEKGHEIQVHSKFAIANYFGEQVTDIWPLTPTRSAAQ